MAFVGSSHTESTFFSSEGSLVQLLDLLMAGELLFEVAAAPPENLFLRGEPLDGEELDELLLHADVFVNT